MPLNNIDEIIIILNKWNISNKTITKRGGIRLHPFLVTPDYTLYFQRPNSRSKPFNMIDMLKCVSRSNFKFLKFFYYLLSDGL